MKKNYSADIRMLEYKNILKKLKGLGFRQVYSANLADTLEISPSLVRKDFLALRTSGNKRGGYLIDELLDEINILLHKDRVTEAVIIGMGKLGAALANYSGFAEENINFAAGFDIIPEKLAPEAKLPILHFNEISEFVNRKNIKLAVLCVPAAAVQKVADELILYGVNGFLNFAPVRLVLPDTCVENQINLALQLEQLILRVDKIGTKTS